MKGEEAEQGLDLFIYCWASLSRTQVSAGLRMHQHRALIGMVQEEVGGGTQEAKCLMVFIFNVTHAIQLPVCMTYAHVGF
jgi:hypothetical protein